MIICKNVVQSPPKCQWYKKTNNSFHKETYCWCNHLWRSGQLFFVHFLMSVSVFRWWDHKPLLRIPGLVVGSWGSWFLLLVSFWSTADWSDQNCLFRSESAGVRHSIFYAFSVGVMNWFVREKDGYMFLYESYYLFSYIIDISVDFEPRLSFRKVSFSSGGRAQALWVVLLVCVYVHVL
jgi:hypothetical protein